MAPESKILILTICSLNKLPGGTSEYDKRDAIASTLPTKVADFLLTTREKVRHWLMHAKETKWQGIPLPELEYNRSLVSGQDFGGNDLHASYFPALRRYDGSFYQALRPEGKAKLFRSKHHVLFISGLYGLLTPMEPIQLYSCPLEINSRPFNIWTEDDALTDVLITYVRQHGICRVFDLTAVATYRRLISWPAIRGEVRERVLHCVGNMAAGDPLLPPLGHLMKDFLLEASEDELLSIKLGSKRNAGTQDIWFHETPGPSSGKPHELEPLSQIADRLERQRRGIIRFLDKAEGCRSNYESAGKRVRRLKESHIIEPKEAQAMRLITNLRNKVIYHEHAPSRSEQAKVEKAWQYLVTRADARGWSISEFKHY